MANFDAGRANTGRVVPGLLEQLLKGENLSWMSDKGRHQPKLGRRDFDRRPEHPNLAIDEVHFEAFVDITSVPGLMCSVPPEEGVDPCGELPFTKGFGQVVVRSSHQPADFVRLEVTGGQHDHRHVAEVPDALEHLPPIDPGQTDIEHDEVDRTLDQDSQSVRSIGREEHVVADPLENGDDRQSDVSVVLDNQDGGLIGHGTHLVVESEE